MHAADELISLVREEEDLFNRLAEVQDRIEELRNEIGAPRPTMRSPPTGVTAAPVTARGRGRPVQSPSSDEVFARMVEDPTKRWTIRELCTLFRARRKVIENRLTHLRKTRKVVSSPRPGRATIYVVTNGASESSRTTPPA